MRKALDLVVARRRLDAEKADEAGVVIASGVLGGESIVGVLVALASVVAGLGG